MGTYLDKTGLQTLWAKIKQHDEATLTAAKNDATSKDNALLNNIAASYIALTLKGAANGVAPLDASKRIPTEYLPGFVDDVVEGASLSAFPSTGETGKIYVAKDTNKTYRWSGSAYVEISASLALGETTGTAYDGAKGKATADSLSELLSRIVQDIDEDTSQDAIPNWSAIGTYLYDYYYNKNECDTKFQPKLVSGTNIATVNGQSLLNGGNIAIEVDNLDMSGYYTKTEANSTFIKVGSDLDAYTFNGQQPAYYLNYNNLTNKPVFATGINEDTRQDTDTLVSPSVVYDFVYNNYLMKQGGDMTGSINMANSNGLVFSNGAFTSDQNGHPIISSKNGAVLFIGDDEYVPSWFEFPSGGGTIAVTDDLPTAITTSEIDEICV